jgi:16S rRNA (uracil1498-N3)-methyltransferase
MRLHRFYITEKVGDKAELAINSTELINQVQRVFRLGKGDHIVVFDGSGFDYECEIMNIEAKSSVLTLKVSKSTPSRFMPSREVYLYQAIVKKDNFEWIVEKATELGVTHIIPVMAEHSEKKSLNEERLKKIAIEASEQSGRGTVPEIGEIVKLEDVVTARRDLAEVKRIVFHTAANSRLCNDDDSSRSLLAVAVFIGPEGGWSEKEVSMFHENNFDIFCLGEQVLRAETAAITALSLVLFTSCGFH